MKKNILFLAFVLLVISCEPEPEDPTLYYAIENTSSHRVKLKVFDLFVQGSNYYMDTTLFLAENSEIIFQYKYLSSYDGVFGAASDSAYIIFDDKKQLIYKRANEKDRNIYDIANFKKEKINNVDIQYTYSITNEDYENATEIK